MKTTYYFLGFKVHNTLHRTLQRQLDHWHALTAVTATEVVAERQYQGGPAFRLQVRLEVSGAHLHAEATGRTLRAALAKVTADLEGQIQARKAKRVERRAVNANSAPFPAAGPLLGAAQGLKEAAPACSFGDQDGSAHRAN